MKEKIFSPRQIGRPDPMKKTGIISAYQNMLQCACNLQNEIERCLDRPEGLGLDFFLQSLQHNTATFIKEKFVELNNVQLPGINIQKVIQQDLLDIAAIEEAIKARNEFDGAWARIKELGFIFPLRKLYVDDETGWNLTPDFYEQMNQKVGRWTQSPEQNFILENVQKICEGLNSLSGLNIIRPQHGVTELNYLADFVEIDMKNAPDFFIPNDILFYQHRLNKYRPKPNFNNNNKSFEYFVS